MPRRRRGPLGPLPDPHYRPLAAVPVRPVRSDNIRAAPIRVGEPLLALYSAVEASRPARGALEPVDDNYWQDLLLDPPGRTPADDTCFEADSHYAHARLDRQPGRRVTVQCECGQREVFDKAELIRTFGADANVVWLARKLINCGNRDKVANYCRAYVLR